MPHRIFDAVGSNPPAAKEQCYLTSSEAYSAGRQGFYRERLANRGNLLALLVELRIRHFLNDLFSFVSCITILMKLVFTYL